MELPVRIENDFNFCYIHTKSEISFFSFHYTISKRKPVMKRKKQIIKFSILRVAERDWDSTFRKLPTRQSVVFVLLNNKM